MSELFNLITCCGNRRDYEWDMKYQYINTCIPPGASIECRLEIVLPMILEHKDEVKKNMHYLSQAIDAGAPAEIVLALLKAAPRAAQFRNGRGILPLHNAMISPYSDPTPRLIGELIKAYPDALDMIIKHNEMYVTPEDLISHSGHLPIESIQLIRNATETFKKKKEDTAKNSDNVTKQDVCNLSQILKGICNNIEKLNNAVNAIQVRLDEVAAKSNSFPFTPVPASNNDRLFIDEKEPLGVGMQDGTKVNSQCGKHCIEPTCPTNVCTAPTACDLHETPVPEEITLAETEVTPFSTPTAGQGDNSTVPSCVEVDDFTHVEKPVENASEKTEKYRQQDGDINFKSTILIGKSMCETNNNDSAEEKCQSFKEICIVEKCYDSYLEKDQTHPKETCSFLVPAIKTSASPSGGSCTTLSSFSNASPAVFQQEGSFCFQSSSIAARSPAPGLMFGLPHSSVGSAATAAPSEFSFGGTAMRSFGVSTPGPFAFGAPNNAATSFPAVTPAAAVTVQSSSFSFGSNTSPVSGFGTPLQTTTPSIPSSSLGLAGKCLWRPRRTPFSTPTAGQGDNSTVPSCVEVDDFTHVEKPVENASEKTEKYRQQDGDINFKSTILIGKSMCETNNNDSAEEKCQSFKEICIVEKCYDSYLEKDQTHPKETCSFLVPAIKTSASPSGGSCTTLSSFSNASPAVFQQEGSFCFQSSSIAARSPAPGLMFGLPHSSVGSAATAAPSEFSFGGTAMRSFGVSTPGPFAFGAPNNAATSFPAVTPAAAVTVQSSSFSFGSNTSPVSGFGTPLQTTTPSIPSSSLGLAGKCLWRPRRTSKPGRRY